MEKEYVVRLSVVREGNVEFRVLTVSREFGSGGGTIAKIIADRLGWKRLDRDLIEAIANAAHVDSHEVSHYDERADPWLRQINREVIRSVALAAGWMPEGSDSFNVDVMTKLTRRIIEDAYSGGNCVIVGRGAQCILQKKPDVFHVFVYAPFCDPVNRLKERLEPGANIEQRIHTVDEERARYLQQRFGQNWLNPHLYELMISSQENEDWTARVILYAMTGRQ